MLEPFARVMQGSFKSSSALSNQRSGITTMIAVVAIVVVLVVAGAGGYFAGARGVSVSNVTQTVTTTVNTGSIPSINQTLVQLSQKEGGSVTCYCVMDTGDWPTMNAIVVKEFPWIKMNYVGLSPGDIVTRAKTEYQTGHTQADLLIDSSPALETLVSAGVLQEYRSSQAIMNNLSGIDPSGYLTPSFGLPIGLIWNTKLVTNAMLPSSYFGLSNPIWKGKLIIDDPSTLNLSGPLFSSLCGSTTNSTCTTWLNSLKANNPTLAASAGDVYTNVASGVDSIGIGYLNDFLSSTNASVGYKVLGTADYFSPVDSALLTGAPHPYTAELLIEFFASYSGAIALSNTGRTPVFTPVAQQYFGQYIPNGATLTEMGAGTNLYTNGAAWTAYFTSIFGP